MVLLPVFRYFRRIREPNCVPKFSATPSAPSPTPSYLFLFYSEHQAARQFQFSFVRQNLDVIYLIKVRFLS
jgi:hypothetical protein